MGLFSNKNPQQVYYRDMPYDYDRLVDVASRAGSEAYNTRFSLMPQILGLLGYQAMPYGKPGREQWSITPVGQGGGIKGLSGVATPVSSALKDQYTDPVTELELENAWRQQAELLARRGLTPGSTGYAQAYNEFMRNAASARGEARTAQAGRLLSTSQMWDPLITSAGGIGSQGLNYLNLRQQAENTKASMDNQGLSSALGGFGSLLGIAATTPLETFTNSLLGSGISGLGSIFSKIPNLWASGSALSSGLGAGSATVPAGSALAFL